jgi:hypothetical protein
VGDPSFIDAFYQRHVEMHRYLMAQGEVSFASDLNTTFTRSLVLAIASYFEHELTAIMREVPVKHAAGNPFITAMLEKHVIAFKYHTWFDWKDLKAGNFFALFGPDFKKAVEAKLKTSAADAEALMAFLQVGSLRNRLVHQNYVQFDITKTPEELHKEFHKALRFMAFVRENVFPMGTMAAATPATADAPAEQAAPNPVPDPPAPAPGSGQAGHS